MAGRRGAIGKYDVIPVHREFGEDLLISPRCAEESNIKKISGVLGATRTPHDYIVRCVGLLGVRHPDTERQIVQF